MSPLSVMSVISPLFFCDYSVNVIRYCDCSEVCPRALTWPPNVPDYRFKIDGKTGSNERKTEPVRYLSPTFTTFDICIGSV